MNDGTHLSVRAGIAALLLLVAPLVHAQPKLRESPPVPPKPLTPRAQILDRRWIEIELPETPYNDNTVTETKRYRVASDDDKAFFNGVEPVAVHHRHWPENAWYKSVPQGPANIAEINVVYRVFLQLPTDLHEGKYYKVTMDPAVAKAGPFNVDFKQPNDVIHLNQVGYRPIDEKVAYLSLWTGQGTIEFTEGPFSVVDERSGKTVFTGQVRLTALAKNEPWSASNVYSLDFSLLDIEGVYRLHVPGVGSSFPFRIDHKLFDDVSYTLFRGLAMERDGDAGLTPETTHWPRPPAHMDDAIDEKTGKQVDLTGGHMDAGDRGKYPHDSADAAGALLAAIQLFPAQVEAFGETLQLRESHNGVPDIIDETLIELDWLVKAVNNSSLDGTVPVYLRPGNGSYELGAPPEGFKGRVMYNQKAGPARSETLFTAGALAMAANTPLLQRYAPERCKIYRAAAEKAFAGFEKHNAEDGYWKDIGAYDSAASPHKWSDEMLVAASNLLELTGDAKYREWIRSQLPPDFKKTKQWTWKVDMPYMLAWLTLSQMKSPLLDPAIKLRAREAVIDWGQAAIRHDGHNYATPFGAPLPWMVNHRVGWYFTGSSNAWPLMIAYGVTGDKHFRDQLIGDWDWLLGTNPLSRTFVTGLGDPEHRPRWIVHEIAQVEWVRYKTGDPTGWSEVPPGLLSADIQAGGYSWFLKDDHNKLRRDAKFPTIDKTPPLYLYHDSWNVEDEMTIERLARTAASLVPLIDMQGASVKSR